MSVKYDSTVNSELIMHTSCGNMSWVGASDYPAATPCNHLFNSEYGAFIYTPESALSSKADGKERLPLTIRGHDSLWCGHDPCFRSIPLQIPRPVSLWGCPLTLASKSLP